MNTKYAFIHITENTSTLRNIVEIPVHEDNEQLLYYEMYRNLPQHIDRYLKSGAVFAIPINEENKFIDILKSADLDNSTKVKLIAYKYKDNAETIFHASILWLGKLFHEVLWGLKSSLSHPKFNNIIRFLQCNQEELQKRIDDILEFCITNDCNLNLFINFYIKEEIIDPREIIKNKTRLAQLANYHASLRTDNNISFIEEILFFNRKEMRLRQKPLKKIKMSESLKTTLKNIVFIIHSNPYLTTEKEISLYEYFCDKTVKNFADELPLENIKGIISKEVYKEIKEIINNHYLVAEYEYRKNEFYKKLRLVQCQKQ